MKKISRMLPALCLAAVGLWADSPAHAAPVLINGGFEAGFSAWTRADQLGSEGSFAVQSGLASPVNGDAVPAPPEGSQAAMSDAGGPGSHVLYQDFLSPVGPAKLSFQMFIGNRGDRFASPATLDFSIIPINQQVRVDILRASSDPFSVSAADVLQTIYQSLVGDTLVSGYNLITADISAVAAAHAGQTLRLRFAEVDNLAQLQLGIDDVQLNLVSEPPSLLLVAGAMLALWRQRARLLSWRRVRPVLLRLVPLPLKRRASLVGLAVWAALFGAQLVATSSARADTTPLTLLDPSLEVSTVVNSGLTQPIGIVFLSANDFLVLEKGSGQVKRVINGVVQLTPVLDLAVNSASERGLLSMVLHPQFPTVPQAFIYWTESITGSDSTVLNEVPLLGNRVDRFIWNGSSFTQDINIIKLRSRQTDNVEVPNHPGTGNAAENGNHNGGVMRFGPDGKLYIFMGDQGRRGWMQNLVNGPFLTSPLADDTFGGPAPDNAHLSGVMLRLNTDGSTPADNPFFGAGASIGGEVGANVQKVFSYGHRNGFGMAFDPVGGWLWLTENADDAYSELNRVTPGLNGGWIQFAGPASRVADFKRTETTLYGLALQQRRYPPTRVAYNGTAALSRLFMLPGASYKDPELSWRFEVGPSGTSFVRGNGLGAANAGTLWMGSARAFSQVGGTGGSLYRIKLSANRLNVDTSADPRLADGVADNLFRAQKFEGTESETLIVGRGFGVTPSIEQGPDGALYVVSLTDGAIYRIRAAAQ